jgi:hypothetical protein
MTIEILGAESLGVRGLCCFIRTGNRKILIDPGIALGYLRYGLLPHPFQVAVDKRIQKKIIERWSEATDIIISHFHGDHVPLKDANPYQLSIRKVTGLNKNARFWTKDPSHFSKLEKERAQSLSQILNVEFIPAEGKKAGEMSFSKAVPHGLVNSHLETVMMTRIKEGNQVFVQAPDIQLLNKEAVLKILSWQPKIALVGGPPLYRALPKSLIKQAWENARTLSKNISTLILDHHLIRSEQGLVFVKKLSSLSKNRVCCAAEFMGKTPLLLEAWREKLYREMPVPDGWHKDYAQGKADTKLYRKWRGYSVN